MKKVLISALLINAYVAVSLAATPAPGTAVSGAAAPAATTKAASGPVLVQPGPISAPTAAGVSANPGLQFQALQAVVLELPAAGAQYKVPMQLTAVAIGKDSNGIPSLQISFKVNGAVVGSAGTGSGGVAKLDYVPDLAPGTYNLEADFNPAAGQNFLAAKISSKIAISKADTVVNLLAGCYDPASNAYKLSSSQTPCLTGGKIDISGHLLRSQDKVGVDGRAVKIKFDGQEIANVSTDSTGKFGFLYASSVSTPGTHQLSAQFAGDTHYAASDGGPVHASFSLPKKAAYREDFCLLAPHAVGVPTVVVTRICSSPDPAGCGWGKNSDELGYSASKSDNPLSGVNVNFSTQTGVKSAKSDSDGFAKVSYIPQSTGDIPQISIVDNAYVDGGNHRYSGCYPDPNPVSKGIATLQIKGPAKATVDDTISLSYVLMDAFQFKSLTNRANEISVNGVKPFINGDKLKIDSSIPIGKTNLHFKFTGDSDYKDTAFDLPITIAPKDN